MTTKTIENLNEHLTPLRQEVNRVEAHGRVFIELRPPFEGLLAPQAQMLLGRLIDGGLRVVEPFAVSLIEENGQFIAEAREVGEVGVGSTRSEALRDLQATLGELYIALERDHDRLGADMAKIWAVMRQKVTKKA